MMRAKENSFRFRRRDVIAIILVALAAAGIFARFAVGGGGDTAEIYLGGRLVKEMPLSIDDEYEVRGEYTNIIEVRGGKVRVRESDCPGGDCVDCGFISRGVIICAPNGLEVRVGDGVDAVAY